MAFFSAGKYRLPLGERAYVMGILNVTPDSFSDGGRFFAAEDAVRHALEMQGQGADMIDIGAQSTRPGTLSYAQAAGENAGAGAQVTPQEELNRLLPVLELLEGKLNIPVSVDTFYPQVAEAVLAHGVSILNDIMGFDDPAMIEVAAKSDCGCIVMHHTGAQDSGIIESIHSFFLHKLETMGRAGIAAERICLDPGVGFGKTHEENLQILANTVRLRAGECAYLMAASRKRVIGAECGNPPFDQRVSGTVAAHSIAVCDGADMVRVHDVPEAVQSVKIASAVRRWRLG
jgi:dihydropteroate synthase